MRDLQRILKNLKCPISGNVLEWGGQVVVLITWLEENASVFRLQTIAPNYIENPNLKSFAYKILKLQSSIFSFSVLFVVVLKHVLPTVLYQYTYFDGGHIFFDSEIFRGSRFQKYFTIFVHFLRTYNCLKCFSMYNRQNSFRSFTAKTVGYILTLVSISKASPIGG